MMPLFELGSCHYDYYLINIRLPVHELKGMNMNIGAIKDMWLVVSKIEISLFRNVSGESRESNVCADMEF